MNNSLTGHTVVIQCVREINDLRTEVDTLRRLHIKHVRDVARFAVILTTLLAVMILAHVVTLVRIT